MSFRQSQRVLVGVKEVICTIATDEQLARNIIRDTDSSVIYVMVPGGYLCGYDEHNVKPLPGGQL